LTNLFKAHLFFFPTLKKICKKKWKFKKKKIQQNLKKKFFLFLKKKKKKTQRGLFTTSRFYINVHID